jgi:peptidoglycan/LPS O-acetylase OafA/YrhL
VPLARGDSVSEQPHLHDPGKERRARSGIPIVAAFDGFRALAVIGVVLFHTFQVSGLFNSVGDSAVGVLLWGLLPRCLLAFFIISGFVLFLPTVMRGGDFGPVSSFWIGRAARVVPAYWLTLVVAMLLVALIVPESFPGAGSILAHFTMQQTPALLLDGPVAGVTTGGVQLGFGVVAPVWTLSVESIFYLTMPLFAAAFYRRPLAGLAVAVVMVIGWQVLSLHIGSVGSAFGIDVSSVTEARFRLYYASQFPSWVVSLAAGMGGAWVYVRLRDRIAPEVLERRALWIVLAVLPVFALLLYLTGHAAVNDPQPFGGLFARQPLVLSILVPLVMAIGMVAFSLSPRRIQRPLANEPMSGLADISYCVYLIHFAVIWFALEELSLPYTGNLWAALVWSAYTFAVSLAFAYASAQLMERPIRRWANKYRRRAQTPVAKPATASAVTSEGT